MTSKDPKRRIMGFSYRISALVTYKKKTVRHASTESVHVLVTKIIVSMHVL